MFEIWKFGLVKLTRCILLLLICETIEVVLMLYRFFRNFFNFWLLHNLDGDRLGKCLILLLENQLVFYLFAGGCGLTFDYRSDLLLLLLRLLDKC